MLKKTLIGLVVGASIVSSLSAETLKKDMDGMANSLASVQRGFLLNDRDKTIVLLADLKKKIVHTLGTSKKVLSLLPDSMKYKSRIALNSGKMINTYIGQIDDIYKDHTLTPIKAEVKAQEALVNIQIQCYKCHNLVRDWKDGQQ